MICNQAQSFPLYTHVHTPISHRRIIDSFFQAAMGMTSRGLRSQEVTSLRAYVGRKVDGFLDTDKHEGIAIDWISSIKVHLACAPSSVSNSSTRSYGTFFPSRRNHSKNLYLLHKTPINEWKLQSRTAVIPGQISRQDRKLCPCAFCF